MAEQYFDGVSTTVGTAYTAGGTSLVLGATLSSLGVTITGTTKVRVQADSSGGTNELFNVTAGSGSTLTVVGGQGSPATTPSNHAVGAVVTFVLTSASLQDMPMAGDVTGPANASTIYSLAAAAIAVAAGSILFASGTAPKITQSTVASAALDAGATGQTFIVQAQSGQTTTKDGGVGGDGGTLILAGGLPGDGGIGGAQGQPGDIQLWENGADVLHLVTPTLWRPENDGVVNSGDIGHRWLTEHAETFAVDIDAGAIGNGYPGYLEMTSTQYLSNNYFSTGTYWFPVLSANLGDLAVANGLGDMNLIDTGREWTMGDNEGNLIAVFGVGSSGYMYLGGVAYEFLPAIDNNSANAAISWTYPAQASTSSASGAAGGSVTLQLAQPGQPATGASHNGGAGGALILKLAGGGTSGSATAGATGTVEIENASGTVEMSWGKTVAPTYTAVTLAASGLTTVSAAALQSPGITLSTQTLTGTATVAFGANTLTQYVNVRGVTLSGNTLWFTCGTDAGGASLTSFTHTLGQVECDSSNNASLMGF